MAAELKKAIELAIHAYVAQTGRAGQIPPDEIIKPLVATLVEVVAGTSCPKCRMLLNATIAATFLSPLGQAVEVSQDLIDHAVPPKEDDGLANVEPAGHA